MLTLGVLSSSTLEVALAPGPKAKEPTNIDVTTRTWSAADRGHDVGSGDARHCLSASQTEPPRVCEMDATIVV